MASVEQLLNVARSQLGTKESPPYSNNVLYTRWYPMPGSPWCDMYISWCFDRVGLGAVEGKHAYTPEHEASFKARGRWVERGGTPRPGDCIFFDFIGRTSHIGFVESVSGRTAYTIEGNTNPAGGRDGGEVMRHARFLDTSTVVGYGRPDLSAVDAPLTDDQKLFWLLWAKEQAKHKPLLETRKKSMPPGTWVAGKHPADVKAVQKALRIPQTGTYGAGTYAAVQKFQKFMALKVDGKVGRETWTWIIYAYFTQGRR